MPATVLGCQQAVVTNSGLPSRPPSPVLGGQQGIKGVIRLPSCKQAWQQQLVHPVLQQGRGHKRGPGEIKRMQGGQVSEGSREGGPLGRQRSTAQ